MWIKLTATSGSEILVNTDFVLSAATKKNGLGTTLTTTIEVLDPKKGRALKVVGVRESLSEIQPLLDGNGHAGASASGA